MNQPDTSLHFCRKEEAIGRMNRWGGEKKPFLFVVDYSQEHSLVELLESVNPTTLLYDFHGVSNAGGLQQPKARAFTWNPHPEPEEVYARKFDVVKRNLLAGNSFLTNLTCRVPVDTDLTLKEAFLRSNSLYKLWMKDTFACFSPEIFIRIKEGKLYTYPMKGTIDALLPDARQKLLADKKEAAEHATIVDLLRNDLSMHANEVKVTKYRYFDRINTHRGAIWQTSSEIAGRLPQDYRSQLGNILFDMLPAGSITGAPKVKTQQIIADAEDYERGFYTGVAGWFDGDNVDSCVLIRFLQQEDGKLYFKAGGGITFQSDMHSEYEEVIQKIYVPIY